jgi:hypothetical protein
MSVAAAPRVAIAPGAQILVRDAVWRVVKVDLTSSQKDAWHVVGVSEIVRGHEAIFLEEIEPSVDVLDPAATALVADAPPGHRATRLFLEGALRDVPPDDPALAVGHRAAMDLLDYQLEPARLALEPGLRIHHRLLRARRGPAVAAVAESGDARRRAVLGGVLPR